MLEVDDLLNLFYENIKKLFFPEEWLQIDMKFSKSEIFTLLYLDKKKEITMSELADYINAPMSTANGIVERLVRSGYIKRERSEADRRIVVLRLTDPGAQFIGKMKDLVSVYLKSILEELTEEEKDVLIRIGMKIARSMQAKFAAAATDDTKESTVKTIEIE